MRWYHKNYAALSLWRPVCPAIVLPDPLGAGKAMLGFQIGHRVVELQVACINILRRDLLAMLTRR